MYFNQLSGLKIWLSRSAIERFARKNIELIVDISAYVNEQTEHIHKQDLQSLLLSQTASLEINNAALKAYLQLDTQK